MIPANAIVLRSVKCSDIHKCIAGYGKATLYGVVDLGRKKFAKVFVMSYMGSRVLQEKLCHLKSTCIQAKQLQYNNDIHIFAYPKILHIQRGFGPIAFGYARVYCIAQQFCVRLGEKHFFSQKAVFELGIV